MSLHSIYLLFLVISLSMLIAQLMVKKKKAVHLAFAAFSGSMAMVAAQHLSAESLGPYQYLIALGTCMTCNGCWLVARGLFRTQKAIQLRHIILAGIIGILVVFIQSIKMADAFGAGSSAPLDTISHFIGAITELLSSTVLMLTAWEAIRGFNNDTKIMRYQRMLFLGVFGSAVFACSVIATTFIEPSRFSSVFPWFVVVSAISILVTIQAILLWQHYDSIANKRKSLANTIPQHRNDTSSQNAAKTSSVLTIPDDEQLLIDALKRLLIDEKLFLQNNLKMQDIATRLNVPEYRVSRIIRTYFEAKNFNQYVNQLRVAYAKDLLETPDYNHWTILVIGLESGFASIGPFNRAFKSVFNCSPNAYRQDFHNNSNNRNLEFKIDEKAPINS